MKKITLLFFTFITFCQFAQTKLTSSLTETNTGSTWVNSNRMEYDYDSNNNLIEEKDLYWDVSTSVWKTSSVTTYSYNAINKLAVEVYKIYDNNTNTVSDSYRTTNVYNSEGKLIQFIDEDYIGGTWVNSYKIDLTYSDNKIVSGLSYEWNGTGWIFGEDSSKITINYNADNTVSSTISDEWDGTTWISSDRTIFSYNGNNYISLLDGQTWDGTSWISDYKEEFTYDGNGNAINLKEYYLDNGVFVLSTNETSTFDISKSISSFANPYVDKTGIEYLFSGNGIVNKILTTTGTNYRTTYNYGEATASINDFNFVNFEVYPNPTNAIVKIDDSKFSLKNIELYNVIGKKIMNSTNNELNVENLENGVYLLKIQSEDGKFTTKRIIKN